MWNPSSGLPLAMRMGGGYLDRGSWVCWHRSQYKRLLVKFGVSGPSILEERAILGSKVFSRRWRCEVVACRRPCARPARSKRGRYPAHVASPLYRTETVPLSPSTASATVAAEAWLLPGAGLTSSPRCSLLQAPVSITLLDFARRSLALGFAWWSITSRRRRFAAHLFHDQ